jgi:hypothetical protein
MRHSKSAVEGQGQFNPVRIILQSLTICACPSQAYNTGISLMSFTKRMAEEGMDHIRRPILRPDIRDGIVVGRCLGSGESVSP